MSGYVAMKRETVLVCLGVAAALTLASRSQDSLSMAPYFVGYNCFQQVYSLLESVTVLGSPAQWMVALLGLCLFPAFRKSGVGAAGATGSPTQSVQGGRPCGSHSIKVEPHQYVGSPFRTASNGRDAAASDGASQGGLFRRLKRVLADGRAQARRLCSRNAFQQGGMQGLMRKRSFNSRSSRSEDVLSSRLSMSSSHRGSQPPQQGSTAKRMGQNPRDAAGGGARWRPSMTRIASGQHLATMAASESSYTSAIAGKRLELLSHNGFQAVDCMMHETTDPSFGGVRQVVIDAHLLQFGALIGEASAELALSQAGSPGAVGEEAACLFGPYDRVDAYRAGWELVAEEHKPGLHYWSWRRHLRKGLYMYKSKTLYEQATTEQITGFTFDMEFRKTWDESMACQLAIPPPAASGSMSLAEAEAKAAVGRSAFMYAKTKFPPPMAARDYTYVRRCWAKPDDGGCYCISRACLHPSPPATGGRVIRVKDFMSGYVIRSSKGVYDPSSPAVEVVNVYFEDPGMPSGIANMGIRRALWPMVQKAEAAFRDFLLTRVHGGLEPPPPERPAPQDSLGAAMAAGGPTAARAAADVDVASVASISAGGMSWKLGSPYVLVYHGYLAMWRSGTGACLSALSGLMSLWCGAFSLGVRLLVAWRSGLAAAAVWWRAVIEEALQAPPPALKTSSSAEARAPALGRAFARLVWPWEMLVAATRGFVASGMESSSSCSTPGIHRSPSTSSAGGDRLSSHPIATPPNGLRRTVSNVSSSGGGGAAASESSTSPPQASKVARRGRGGLARRCAVLAVKVAKVAGAGWLLRRVNRPVMSLEEAAKSPAQPHQPAAQEAQQARQRQNALPQRPQQGPLSTSGRPPLPRRVPLAAQM